MLDHHFVEQIANSSHGDFQTSVRGYGQEDLIVKIVFVLVGCKNIGEGVYCIGRQITPCIPVVGSHFSLVHS